MGFTVKQVEKLIREAKPGAFADGDGLYLKITPTGSASWQYRYQLGGKRRMMGLGACAHVTLAEAREKAADARKLVKGGIDPLDQKEAEQTAVKTRQTTFRDVAKDYIDSHRAGWRNAKHAQQWENTLATYAHPKIGDKPVADITTEDVLGILKPIWQTKAETASRLRNRIELVIDAARAKNLSTAANPAAWRGHLDKLLPKRSKASKGHHAALPYAEIPAFWSEMEKQPGTGAKATQFAILTAARSGEVRLMTWRELDFKGAIWTVPAERMKAGKIHRVPLSAAALSVLESVKPKAPKPDDYVFPGRRDGRPLSDMSLTAVLRRMARGELTMHGFRSTFRDWCAEETHYPNIVAEQALAHTVGSAVEAAYRRGDLLEKRRALMADWATYCTTKPAENVVPIKSTTAA